MGQSGRRNLRAYTLIELVAVMLILSMAIGFVVVRADSLLPTFEIDREAADVALALRDARSRAILAGRTLRVELYPESHEMIYFYDEPELLEDGTVDYNDEPIGTYLWSDDVKLVRAVIGRDEVFLDQSVVLKFWPNGLCTPVRLYLQHEKNKNLKSTIRLNPLTGRTQVTGGVEEPEEYEMKVSAPRSRL